MKHDNWKDTFGQALADALEIVDDEDERWLDSDNVDAVRDLLLEKMPPIDMVLHCPKCHKQHIDVPEPRIRAAPGGGVTLSGDPSWNNPPHRSHLCHGCGHIWRPADVPTNGVLAITTKGKNDTPPEPPIEWNSGHMLDGGGIWK